MDDKRPPAVPVLIAATIDCSDLERMTQFWGSLLDVEFQIAEPFGFLAHAPGPEGHHLASAGTGGEDGQEPGAS